MSHRQSGWLPVHALTISIVIAMPACFAQQLTVAATVSRASANLESREPSMRASAAQELGQMGPAARDAAGTLVTASGDRYPQVRLQAVKALGAILYGSTDSKVVPGVVKALVQRQEDTSSDVRSAAQTSIETIGAGAVAPIVDVLTSTDELGARRFAAESLVRSRLLSVDAATRMEPLLSVADEGLRRSCAQAVFGAVSRCASQGVCVNELPNVKSLYAAMAESDDPVLRDYATGMKANIQHLEDLSQSVKETGLDRLRAQMAPYAPFGALLLLVGILAYAYREFQWKARNERSAQLLRQQTQENVRLHAEIQLIGSEKAVQEQKAQARAILKRFVAMPDSEVRDGFAIASAFRDSSDVSGDFYNWFSRIDGSVCVYLVDVEGNGIDAAVQATHAAKVLERTLTRGDIEDAPTLLDNADRAMYEELSEPNIAVTMCLVEVYPDRINLANAGMPAPLLFRNGQAQPQPLHAAGAYVGAGYSRFPAKPRSHSTEVSDADILTLFSDGVSEALDTSGHPFGRTGIEAAVTRNRDAPPDVIAKGILEAAARHKGDEKPQDDQTVVVIRFGQYKTSGAGTRTLIVVPNDEEAEFTLVNSADTADVCHTDLQAAVKSWLRAAGRPMVEGKVWGAIWEGLMNAIAYGSSRGEVISIKMRNTKGRIVVDIEQPKEWRDWDKSLGSARKARLPHGAPRPDSEEDLGGTATLLRLAGRITASRQGRLLTLVFEPEEMERVAPDG
jgi:serine phosphatase RsbU (regulator of sigma subunit)